MKPLLVLLIAFITGVAVSKIAEGQWNWVFAGNLSMFVMLCFTAMGHFMFTKGMRMMIPGFLPFRKELVYLTGIAEVLLGLGLIIPGFRYLSGVALVLLFMLMLPANIRAAIQHINFEKASYDGSGIKYLWFRVPLQAFFISWVLFFSVKDWCG